ncbi:hypothetical protein CA13_67260 [Planctomycetes bacterium CA13]|uniref:Uncharacterized protein n=1 Tax=Novipirellula herctigrandis TaxID=2527986 RepID=A0A5C5YMS7_9BACT|nr:hypothetical protein CA13_67260 [Planctomycetes bacterium CA13]
MLNLLTYTVQSVHGLQDTFQVSPNGTIDTHQLCAVTPQHKKVAEPVAKHDEKKSKATPNQVR